MFGQVFSAAREGRGHIATSVPGPSRTAALELPTLHTGQVFDPLAGLRDRPRRLLFQRLPDLLLMPSQFAGRLVLPPRRSQSPQGAATIETDVALHTRDRAPITFAACSRLRPQCSSHKTHNRLRTTASVCDSRSHSTIRCSDSVNSIHNHAMIRLLAKCHTACLADNEVSQKHSFPKTSHSEPRGV